MNYKSAIIFLLYRHKIVRKQHKIGRKVHHLRFLFDKLDTKFKSTMRTLYFNIDTLYLCRIFQNPNKPELAPIKRVTILKVVFNLMNFVYFAKKINKYNNSFG